MKKTRIITISALLATGISSMVSCRTSEEQTNSEKTEFSGENRQAPSVIELLTEMDEDKDGQLSRSEVRGPLEQNFTAIDTNGDGFLSVEELQNAPKPEGKPEGRPPRGERPPGGQGGPPRN